MIIRVNGRYSVILDIITAQDKANLLLLNIASEIYTKIFSKLDVCYEARIQAYSIRRKY